MLTIYIPLPKGSRHNAAELIVLHAMAEYIHVNQAVKDYYATKRKPLELHRDYHAPEWLRAIRYSAHRLTCPNGDSIKCRDFAQGAFHASGFNTNSLGIEFLVPGVHTYESFLEALKTSYLTSAAFDSGIETVREWMKIRNIEKGEIKTHHELSPERKQDPGDGFPLIDFLNAL